MKRMTHPDHGVHIAYSDIEEAECLKNGWSYEEIEKPKQVSDKKVKLSLKSNKHDNSKHNNL